MKCFGCSKEIKNQKLCDNCDNIFCSESCYQAHSITYHRIHKQNNIQNIQQKKILPNSKYLVNGYIIPKIKYDNIYELQNFVPIMDKNNPKIIGSGSYGQVFLALNTINKKLYAIKHMEKDCLQKTLHSLSGIYTEIEIQSKIRHPNIIQLLYVKETKNSFDLVMDYANSGSLFDYIRKNKGLSEKKSFELFIQIVNAIYFLHNNDLIHRDIKPENILLFNNNIVKLCDFGWCVKLNGGQRDTFCGTTEYMAPEMVNQKEYSKEIDIWSLGVLLYEMLHGYSPFIPNKKYFNEKEVIENIKIHKLKFDKKVSKDCKDLIFHLLDENREKRYKIEDIFNSNFVKHYENNKNENNNIKVHRNKTPSIIKEIKKLNVICNDEKQPIIVKRINDNSKNKIIVNKKEYFLNNVKNIQKFDNYSNVQHLHDDFSKEKIKQKKLINNNTTKNFYPKTISKTREKEIIDLLSLEKPINNNDIKLTKNDINKIVYHPPNKNNSKEKIKNNNKSIDNNQINHVDINDNNSKNYQHNNDITNSPIFNISTEMIRNNSDKDNNINTINNITQHDEQKNVIKNNDNNFNENENNNTKKEKEISKIVRDYSIELILTDNNNNTSNKEEIITPVTMIKKLPVNVGNSLINQNYNNNQNIKFKQSFSKENLDKNEIINRNFYGNISNKNINHRSQISYQLNRCYLLNKKNKTPIMIRNISETNFSRLNQNNTNSINFNEKKPQNNFKKMQIISNKTQTIELKSDSNNKSLEKYSKSNDNGFVNNINIPKKISLNTNTNFYRKKNDLSKYEVNISLPKTINNSKNISPKTNKSFNLIRNHNKSSDNLCKNIVYSNINYVIINNNNRHINRNKLNNTSSLMDETKQIDTNTKQIKNSIVKIPNEESSKNNTTINNNNNKLLSKYNNEKSEILHVQNESFIRNIDNNKNNIGRNNYYNNPIDKYKVLKSKSVSKCEKKDLRIKKPFYQENNLNILNNLTVNNSNNYNKVDSELKNEKNKKTNLKKNSSEILLKKYICRNDEKKKVNLSDEKEENNNMNKIISIKNKDNNSLNEEKIIENVDNNDVMNSCNNKDKIGCIKETFVSDYSRVIDENAFDEEEVVEDSQKTPKKISDKVKIFPKELISDFNKNVRNKSKDKKK